MDGTAKNRHPEERDVIYDHEREKRKNDDL